ncbi:GNAT family N-acetyltransferase [Maribius pontilimi]|uniref:GNAT family N-acetyltransferase n=1 Tax=Palleronia pontilimi TaxID=1964209 RepID=A0A934MG80_9RHOB|nr:GNAT family N-acetyltransferase [Palleronia pontilimi]MBJ3762139.1 GNAT family N-acetyltransferase [Palleronia pontilimi]
MRVIADANPDDLDQIRDLHAASWRDAYAPFVPDDALGRLDAHMAQRWSRLPSGCLCLWQDGALSGFVRIKSRQGWPYIDNLHTRPDLRGQGIGGVLLVAAMQRLAERGGARVWLTVIAGNRRARSFYRRHGGWEGAPIVEDVLSHPTVTRPVIWNRLTQGPAKNA